MRRKKLFKVKKKKINEQIKIENEFRRTKVQETRKHIRNYVRERTESNE